MVAEYSIIFLVAALSSFFGGFPVRKLLFRAKVLDPSDDRSDRDSSTVTGGGVLIVVLLLLIYFAAHHLPGPNLPKTIFSKPKASFPNSLF